MLPRTPSFRLDGRRALVAGASSGIGLAAAAALAEAGAEVVMAARREAELAEAAEAIRAAGGRAVARVLDVTDLAAQQALVAEAGPFHVLVNAAGLARHSPALDTDPADYDAAMGLNVRAAFFLAREVARTMPRGGSIVMISSQMGHVGGPDRAVYCATKHAVEGMTKAMALEWGPRGIRVNTLGPTFIRTALAAQTLDDPARREWVLSKIALGRVGEVEDVMGPVVFLASDASALVTGTALLVDGGWTAA
jgi:NAD(P)-dependent dehydrogenase (short-subunit alcohol dehydrogenase family)